MPRRSRLVRLGIKWVGMGLVVYLSLCALLFFGQRWMVFPGASAQGKPEGRIDYGARGTGVRLTTADGVSVAGVFGQAQRADGSIDPVSQNRPTILYFYGNGSSVSFSQMEFDQFRRLGCNVMIPDYTGYGDSAGTPGERGCYQTADAAYDWLIGQKTVDPRKIVVVGWSLGGAVAIDLAARKPVAGLAVFNAFTTAPEVAGHLMSWAPARWLMRYRFDNLSKMPRVHCPALICNGRLDALVDPAMGDRLAAAAGGPVTRFIVPGADHNTIFSVDPTAVFGRLGQFVEQVTAER